MFVLILLGLFLTGSWFSPAYATIPESIKQSYATKIYQSFLLQSEGKSTLAIYQFKQACEEAKQAGENISKLILAQELLAWYRKYGSFLNLFYKDPVGDDQIIGSYPKYLRSSLKPARNHVMEYHSEYGKTPEQAYLITDFLVGVAETVSAIFCATVGSSGVALVVAPIVGWDGLSRIYNAIHKVYFDHEQALLELQQWEKNARSVTQSESHREEEASASRLEKSKKRHKKK